MTERKSIIFTKHETLLRIIYNIGGGLIFATQLASFMRYKHTTQLWRDVNDVKNNGLVEIIKFHRHNIIKIKAYAIKRIVGKQQVDSVEVSGYKIKKSAMICAIILKNYELSCTSPEEFLLKVRKYSNFYFPHDNDVYLYNQIKLNFTRYKMNIDGLNKEIKAIAQRDSLFRQTVVWIKNLNIYVEKYGRLQNDDLYGIGLSILDINSDFNHISVAKRLYEVMGYYKSIFGNDLPIVGAKRLYFIFNIYVPDELRLLYVEKQIEKVKQYLHNSNLNLNNISFTTYNLKLTSALYSGQKIIL